MEQFVRVLSAPNEQKINQEIKIQREKGYKVANMAASQDSYGMFAVVILFEKI